MYVVPFSSLFSVLSTDTHKLTFLCTWITVNVKFGKFFMFTYWACCLFHWAVYTYILNIQVFRVLVVFTYVKFNLNRSLFVCLELTPTKATFTMGGQRYIMPHSTITWTLLRKFLCYNISPSKEYYILYEMNPLFPWPPFWGENPQCEC